MEAPSILVLGDDDDAALEVALGDDHILRPGPASVRVAAREAPRTPLPAPFPDRLDREDEAAALVTADGHVNVVGPAGIGKTYVLALSAIATAAYVDARGLALDDLLQAIAEEALELDPPAVLTPERRRRELGAATALVALDDVSLPGYDVERLLDEAPRCRLIVTSRRAMLRQGELLAIDGLPPRAAVELVANVLGRPLEAGEAVAARRLGERFEGHPLKLRQAAWIATAGGAQLEDLAEELDGDGALGDGLLRALPAEDREMLASLAAAGGPLSAERVAALAERRDAPERLAQLRHGGLVQAHGAQFVLAGPLADLPPGDARRERAIASLVDWAERDDPALVLREVPALMSLLRWAAEHDRTRETLRLAHALNRALPPGRRWGSWGRVLEIARDAAARDGDPREEAWALHQLGTRAHALGDPAEAAALLTAALDRRETAGDADAAAASRHNLAVVHGEGVAPPRRRGLRRLLG
jgi:hypothetical protein